MDRLPLRQPIVTRGQHFPTLDGLRGVAILAVVIFHLFQHYPIMMDVFPRPIKLFISLGQNGVDLFFCLSGFLITGILWDARNDEKRWKDFMVRRSVRIFPLYFFTLALIFLVIPWQTGVYTTQYRHQIWAWLYLVNVNDSFNLSPANFGHLWSLSVEEQFYLFWPFIVWVCKSLRQLIICCLGVMGLAVLTRGVLVYFGEFHPSLLPCRMDCLAAGGVVAAVARLPIDRCLWQRWTSRLTLFSFAASIVAFICLTGFGHGYAQVIKFLIMAVTFSMIIAMLITVTEHSLVYKISGSKSLRWFGKHSYALYIVHPYVLSHVDYLIHRGDRFHVSIFTATISSLLTFGLSAIVSVMTWYVIERPFLKLKRILAPTPSEYGSRWNSPAKSIS